MGEQQYSAITQKLFCRIGDRTIHFFLKQAGIKNAPIIFIFHGHGHGETPAKFQSPNWNVVCPMDKFGKDEMGSWYLGEHGDYFWLEAIQRIIEEVRFIAGTGRLFMWGSSMGGYASILHARLNGATAAYANIPQVKLLGSKYGDGWGKPYFQYIFGTNFLPPPELNDLSLLFKTRSRTLYFLCFNQLEGNDYLNEQCLPLVNSLHRVRNKFYLEIRPFESHGLNHSISEAVLLFKKFQ